MAQREDNQRAYKKAKALIKDIGVMGTGEIIDEALDLAKWIVALVHDEDAIKSLLAYPPK